MAYVVPPASPKEGNDVNEEEETTAAGFACGETGEKPGNSEETEAAAASEVLDAADSSDAELSEEPSCDAGCECDGEAETKCGSDSGDECDEYEEVELEFSEDDIVSYLVDEDDNEIGFTLLDEEGNEVEYYYVDEDDEDDEADGRVTAANGGSDEEDNPYDLGITREGVTEATNDMNAIYKDGIAVATELKGAFDDIKTCLDFTNVFKK